MIIVVDKSIFSAYALSLGMPSWLVSNVEYGDWATRDVCSSRSVFSINDVDQRLLVWLPSSYGCCGWCGRGRRVTRCMERREKVRGQMHVEGITSLFLAAYLSISETGTIKKGRKLLIRIVLFSPPPRFFSSRNGHIFPPEIHVLSITHHVISDSNLLSFEVTNARK